MPSRGQMEFKTKYKKKTTIFTEEKLESVQIYKNKAKKDAIVAKANT